MQHELISPAFIDPRWFNTLRTGTKQGKVIDARKIEVLGETLRVAHPETIALHPGQIVHVSIGRTFCFQTDEEVKEQECLVQERRAAYEQEQRSKDKRNREEAIAFNMSLNIPVQWVTGIKAVLSGLTENSMCNGTNRATVEHVLLQEDLCEGRLQRHKDDFLCTPSSGSNGKLWTEPHVDAVDSNGEVCQYKVTCKQCLKIAEKWKTTSRTPRVERGGL